MLRLLLPALLLLSGTPAVADPQPFRVVNRTGQPAAALHAVRSGRPDWGGNLLNRGALPPGGAFALRPSTSAGCQFDLRLVLADGREVVARSHDICVNPTVLMEGPGGSAMGVPAKPAPAATAVAPGVAGSARPNPNARVASGTGFVVAPGRVLTNQHVINGCNRILVRTADGRTIAATPPARVDAQRDLALLALPEDPGPVLAFRGNAVRRGEAIVTYGFPLAGLLSSGPTLTTGEVSALSGLGDNARQFQISAPVQPGNSGGPLLDRHGNVAGIVVSKLNAQRIAQRTGDIPQNVNFAVKGSEAIDFLRRAGIEPVVAQSQGPERNAAEVGEIAHRSTVFIRCER